MVNFGLWALVFWSLVLDEIFSLTRIPTLAVLSVQTNYLGRSTKPKCQSPKTSSGQAKNEHYAYK